MSTSNNWPIRRVLLFALALAASASMWFYVDSIFVPRQIEDQKKDEVPRGNLSDLYPRWLGARELLLRNRNPYADDITRECQIGYYGRALDPSRKTDPEDREAFAYPVYVVFLLAPFVHLSFHSVQWAFHLILIVLTLFSALLWLRALRWPLPSYETAACAILLISSVPGLQAIKLQQLTLLVAFLLAATVALVAEGYLPPGGMLLAFATIKPQLAWPLVVWLLFWAMADWKSRRQLVLSFIGTMLLLVTGGQWLLPGWLGMFLNALRQYHQYTHNLSVLEADLGIMIGRVLGVLAVAATAWRLWRERSAPAENPSFAYSLALIMALTVLIVPMTAPYNQILLLPTVFYLARRGTGNMAQSLRFAYAACGAALMLPWVASLLLALIYFTVSPQTAMAGWKLPFLTTFSIPLLVFAVIISIPAPSLAEQPSAR